MRHRDSQTLFKEREERVRRRKVEKRAIREQKKEAQTGEPVGSTIQTETEAEESEEDTSSEEEDDIESSRSVG